VRPSTTVDNTAEPLGGRHSRTVPPLHTESDKHILEEGGEGQKEEKILRMMQTIRVMYKSIKVSDDQLRAVVEEAYRTTDLDFAVEAAVEWGAGFVWPSNVHVRDEARAKKHGFRLCDMAEEVHEEMLPDRLSSDRISQWVPESDPDLVRLQGLVRGMRVLTDTTEFSPNGKPPPLRKLYERVKGAVNKTLLALWEEGLVFIVTKEVAQMMGKLHYTPTHWTKKVGKPGGRYLFDSKDRKFGPALNSDRARELLRELYGDIIHPTIEDIIIMILDFEDNMREQYGEEFSAEEVMLWKADLRQAFTLLFFDPNDTPYLATELTDGLVMIYHSGLFGWTGTPYAFQVITRVITRLVQTRVMGKMLMYVDDGMGVTLRQHLQHDQDHMRVVCEGLLGSKAMAPDKWESGRRLTMIGWTVDLDSRRVTISRKSFMKTLYGFFSADLHAPFQVRTLQKLGSWASRYSLILRVMRPFSAAIYAETAGMDNIMAFKHIGVPCQCAILMWRVSLVLLMLDESTFARSLDSFRPSFTADLILGYDASLEGIGFGFRPSDVEVDNDNMDYEQLGVVTLPWGTGKESKYMNVLELFAVTVALFHLAHSGRRGLRIWLRGDNRTSLEWSSEEHFRTVLGLPITVAFISICVAFDFEVVGWSHVRSEDNVLFDRLSRGGRPEDVGVTTYARMESGEWLNRLINLCDPTVSFNSVPQFIKWWTRVNECVEIVKT